MCALATLNAIMVNGTLIKVILSIGDPNIKINLVEVLTCTTVFRNKKAAVKLYGLITGHVFTLLWVQFCGRFKDEVLNQCNTL